MKVVNSDLDVEDDDDKSQIRDDIFSLAISMLKWLMATSQVRRGPPADRLGPTSYLLSIVIPASLWLCRCNLFIVGPVGRIERGCHGGS